MKIKKIVAQRHLVSKMITVEHEAQKDHGQDPDKISAFSGA